MRVHTIYSGGLVIHTDNRQEIEDLQRKCKHTWKLVICKDDWDTYKCSLCQKEKVVRCTFDEDFS